MNHQLSVNGVDLQPIVARIGVLSDTHMPDRLARLPEGLFTALRGVDLLLHAGDVGELWVLDELSQIAPVLAVHGNDDTYDAQRELPYQQIITVAGQRILLWHSHFPDRAEEMASRQGDSFYPKLERNVAQGQRAGAKVVVFGHWHIPLAYEHKGVLVINPGALASGNFITRQEPQTAVILSLLQDGRFHVSPIDLAHPTQAYILLTDLTAGFKAELARYNPSILSPELETIWQRSGKAIYKLAPDLVIRLLRHLASPCWAGEKTAITYADLLGALAENGRFSPDLQVKIKALLAK